MDKIFPPFCKNLVKWTYLEIDFSWTVVACSAQCSWQLHWYRDYNGNVEPTVQLQTWARGRPLLCSCCTASSRGLARRWWWRAAPPGRWLSWRISPGLPGGERGYCPARQYPWYPAQSQCSNFQPEGYLISEHHTRYLRDITHCTVNDIFKIKLKFNLKFASHSRATKVTEEKRNWILTIYYIVHRNQVECKIESQKYYFQLLR